MADTSASGSKAYPLRSPPMPTTPWNPEHEALRDSVRRLVDGPLAAAAAEAEAGALPHAEALRHCEELGLLELDDVRAEVVVAEELGRLRSGGLVAVLLDAMVTAPLGLREPHTAVARFAEVAVTDPDVSGRLPFVVAGRLASHVLLPAHGILVDIAAASIQPLHRSHSLRGAGGASITLDAAPYTRIEVAAAALHRAELREAAAAVGSSWQTFREACEYAQQREAFGRPIAKFQVNRHALADAATKLTAAEAMVHDLAWEWSRGRAVDPAAARLYAGAVAVEVADRAIQLHGGYGYTSDFDAQRAWRDAHALRVGDDERRGRMPAQGARP